MLHPDINLTQASDIHGRGLISTARIFRGQVVWKRDPDEIKVRLDEVMTWPPGKQAEFFWHAYQYNDEYFVLPKDIDAYMNHSCDPNTWWQDDDTLVARRDIQVGEEVTYDYATT